MCHKCADRKAERSPKDAVKGIVLRVWTGCKRLSGAEWDEGWFSDDPLNETYYQHNCPISLVMRIEDEKPV
jgi:hypothetical protein